MSEVEGPDGVKRCSWGNTAPDYAEYHDTEWGVELHGQAALFERLTLEGFQSGLSWLTILRKRDAFREVFADFQPERIAEFGERDRERLLGDTRIVRNQAKIDATINNARATLQLEQPLDELMWSFAPAAKGTRPATMAEMPATTPESIALARALKKRGFRFVGPTTCYAMMQATGMVDDHVQGCWLAS